MLFRSLGRAEEAKTLLEDALAKARSQQKQGHEAQLLILLGRQAAQSGNTKQAIVDLEIAGELAVRGQFLRMQADAMFELAKLYRDAGNLTVAEECAAKGLAASQAVGDRYYVPRNLTILAELKTRRGRITEASALYSQAEDVVDGMLINADEPYWNSSVAGSMSQTYLRHFELLTKSGDIPAAFGVLERVRGRTLVRALEDRKAIQTAESEQAVELDHDLADIQLKLMQTNSASQREQLLDTLTEYERRLGLAWTRGDAPDERLPVRPTPLRRVQADMEPGEVFLEYVLDEPNSFCLSITKQTAHVQTLPVGRKEVEKLTQGFIDEIRGKGASTQLANRLYTMLVKPISEAVAGTRLIVAPDGILNRLPLEALRDDRGEYLLKSRVISYVPSGTFLNVIRRTRGRPAAPRPFLGVGDVAYENQGGVGHRLPPAATALARIERGIADLSGLELHDLPQTREEVEEIGKIVGPDALVLLGKDATETAFKKEPLDQFRVLHLAVHGFADTQYPERSALILGVDPKSGDDGLLQIREVIRLRLNADLTTLSACDTGLGKLQGQEGVSNLVEAFLVAGSKSVVASLWSADDTSTSALMQQFYQHLALGETVSSALRDAKLDMLTKYGDQLHPFYWAAFVAVGETSTSVVIKQP